MSTRGSIVLGGKHYYLQSDAYPSFARDVIKKTLATKPRTVREFIIRANKIAGFKWINGRAPRDFLNGVFEEYRWYIDLKKRKFKGEENIYKVVDMRKRKLKRIGWRVVR